MRLSLDELFPAAPPHSPHSATPRPNAHLAIHPEDARVGKLARGEIPTRWASIYALELRGLGIGEIAQALGLAPGSVSRITTDARYIKYREEHLSAIDAEFVQMKPLAFAALRSGLNSNDENTALRASEQWFKGAGFGGFAKDPVPQTRLTAEDVAAQLLAGLNVNVQVNVGGAAEGGEATRTSVVASTPDIDA